jgi:hypothetical protein
MKSVEQIIHEAYEANSYLTALIPADKFVTGMAKGMSLPYATMNRESSLPSVRSNTNRIDRLLIRFQVWASHSTGASMRDTLIDAFDNWSSESSNPRVVMMRKANDFAIEEDDGVWQFLIDFQVEIQAR